MADSDSNRFSRRDNIPDDSEFVHEAMHALGFECDFADLATFQMSTVLTLAESLKRGALCT